MVRNSVKYVPWKDYKVVTADLKQIYQSITEEEALLALEQFTNPVRVQKMDYADSELESCVKSFYDCV